MQEKPYDVVLWGATGFTGSLVAEYLAERYGGSGGRLRWAIAGRDEAKLIRLRDRLAKIDSAAATLDILTGDSANLDSLAAIAAKSRVICSTVGPYFRYGTPLVQACVDAGIAYCDLTGEVHWIAANIERFHERAVATGARIVHSCGFDSIPSDLGVQMLQEAVIERHGRPADRVNMVVKAIRGGFSGGTVASMMTAIEAAREDPAVRKALVNPYALLPAGKQTGPRQSEQAGPRLDEDFGCWTAPFVMARINSRIVLRSNALAGFPYGEDFRYQESMGTGRGTGGRLRAIATSAGLGGFVAASALAPTRALLKRFALPSPGEGPNRDAREAGFFRLGFAGRISDAPDVLVCAEVTGSRDPGYGQTSRMLGETAVCLAKDTDKLPDTAGILTPAIAMGAVLRERQCESGMAFNVD